MTPDFVRFQGKSLLDTLEAFFEQSDIKLPGKKQRTYY